MLRLHPLHEAPAPAAGGRYVLYWMQQQRRLHHNHALQHAVHRARQHRLPLLIYEGLRCDYPWASERHHAIALAGMSDHQTALVGSGIGWLPYIETQPGGGRGLVELLLTQAAEVVTDAIPNFVVPGHNRALARLAAARGARAMAVDAAGFVPTRLLSSPSPSAAQFRRHLHRHAAAALAAAPTADPLAQHDLPPFQDPWLTELRARFGDHRTGLADDRRALLAGLPIDHGVSVIAGRGGRTAGERELRSFVAERLQRYDTERNRVSGGAASGLSPYLHWGHLGTWDVLEAVFAAVGRPDPLALGKAGGRLGFWRLPAAAECLLDELITWRELGWHSHALLGSSLETYQGGVPAWARASLEAHRHDRREAVYDEAAFAAAATHDPLWNAAQRQLLRDGYIHNYLRMLWGKCILAWSAGPEEALHIMHRLNDRYALDGRDPNSWTGFLWTLGRYDHPWPERPVFGSIRCMTTGSTRRKLELDDYLGIYGH
jgi:deoxyribodipyrimidine photo-lyase